MYTCDVVRTLFARTTTGVLPKQFSPIEFLSPGHWSANTFLRFGFDEVHE